ncbi:dephospho-CoA kinase [Halomonas sp. 141]|uniref:dephospho-CoA kinase n=1 Tax=unclassified Halomonas TaxID=2609666 RepID=UPI0009C0FFA6|nr:MULTISPECIES: dephospho-CoA kinase [unclassified Halomonas]PJX15615.1 dephospho-CoA kinase [Halomonas sp. 141]
MIIGLTGGIGSGKSTVARAFGELGVGWVDADDIAREMVMPGEPALAAIAQRFGQQVLDADGGLNRAALRQIVFSDPEQRRWLESETHPRIRERLQLRLKALALNSPYVLLVSPLLFESGQDALAQRTLVVDVPEELQRSRTLARDGVSEAQVRAILAAQLSRQERLSRAHDVIDNSGSLEHLQHQVVTLHRRYSTIAHD